MGRRMRHAIAALGAACAAAAVVVVAADRGFSPASAAAATVVAPEEEISLLNKIADFMWRSDGNSYQHVWPPMEFGWKMVLGSLIGFFGASFGSVGGVGGGGIFVPMLTLIIGFDPKSSTAMSKCMITGAAVSTVYYNLKLKHPTLDMPMIDYDLALLIQPMLMLGISIGVIFNVIFPDWLVTVLLIVLFLGTSTKAFLKGVETWKKETIIKREIAKRLEQISEEPEYAPLPTGPGATVDAKIRSDEAPSLMNNIYWKEFGLLTFVWLAFLAIQITKNYTSTCSTWYWVLNFLQIPVSVGVTMYEALGLMNGKRVLSSKGSEQTTLKFHQLCIYCFFGVMAGLVGGLLGLGGGFIMGPLFLELGIPPQVSSATATFAMMFSASMSVVEYYLLNRFPVPYAAYFVAVAFVAAIIGQHVVRRLISWLGRASLIIFILAFMIFVSAISLGGVGISNMIQKFQHHEYMGFENLCKYDA
ncbi:sulfite exporter TauE/SafE family protein 3 [Lolium perenne]|uniref:sulfite exporter TauE/SafE family protein 3 n=1 Tax=Lolium perenne TaxID=4522 RepID=UPI0021EB17A4|nr:sulfite exporter TauE/SafE family protein 3-like [Lolium perenne]